MKKVITLLGSSGDIFRPAVRERLRAVILIHRLCFAIHQVPDAIKNKTVLLDDDTERYILSLVQPETKFDFD